MVGEPEQNGDRQGIGDFGFDGDTWIDMLREAEAPPRLGRLGPYDLIAEVSRGGQGIVYRAREPGTNRLLCRLLHTLPDCRRVADGVAVDWLTLGTRWRRF